MTVVVPDLWSLYERMLSSRLFEEAVNLLWRDGLISGEMHLGTGEEAVIAGVVDHLRDGDGLALDHRGSAALLMRGVDPVLILRELLGRADGLCAGMGGHMHLLSKEHLAASSGIVGAEGPTAAGFALAAQYTHSGGIAVAFFGEGAMNQGMLMESMNLATAWNLPVVFVCKDDDWSIVTRSEEMTGGDLNQRARGLGLSTVDVDGRDVAAVWEAAREAIARARAAQGPTFLRARCVHLEGHFLGLKLLRIVRDPLSELPPLAGSLALSMLRRGGAGWRERAAGLQIVLKKVLAAARDPRRDPTNDPVLCTRNQLLGSPERLQRLEDRVVQQMGDIVVDALAGEVQ